MKKQGNRAAGTRPVRANCSDLRRVTRVLLLSALVSVGAYESPSLISPVAAGDSADGDEPRSSGFTTEGAISLPIVATHVPVRAPSGDDGDPRSLPHGSRIVTIDLTRTGERSRNLTPGFAAAGRPQVSFDGERILFVGRRNPSDPTGIWEMRNDGTELRRVLQLDGDCESVIYLSTLYTLDAERPVYRIGFSAKARDDGRQVLFTSRMDGSDVQRITFAPNSTTDPLLLSDGRLVFSMWFEDRESPVGRSAPASALFTVNTDGTDVFPFAGNHDPAAGRFGACETESGNVVYVEASGTRREGGSLISVSRSRSLTTRRAVTRTGDGAYRSPTELPDGRLLVSYRPATGRRDESFGLYVLDPASGGRAPRLFDDPDWHELDAVVVRPRAEPPGRSTVVSHEIRAGQLYCMDAHISDSGRAGEPEGAKIARVRISTTSPSPGPFLPPSGSAAHDGVLGTAQVESDGSFFLEVPARMPLRLETLDEAGTVLRSMNSWIWVMPVERRGCIGCHEDRELTPPNRHVLALRKPPHVLVSDTAGAGRDSDRMRSRTP